MFDMSWIKWIVAAILGYLLIPKVRGVIGK